MNSSPRHNVIDTVNSKYWYDDSGVMFAELKNVPDIGVEQRAQMFSEFKKIIGSKKFCLIVDVSHSQAISKESRLFNAKQYPKYFKAVAFVATTALGTMIAHLYLGIKPSPIPSRIFNSHKEAREWIEAYL